MRTIMHHASKTQRIHLSKDTYIKIRNKTVEIIQNIPDPKGKQYEALNKRTYQHEKILYSYKHNTDRDVEVKYDDEYFNKIAPDKLELK